jgi:hypothetical protein
VFTKTEFIEINSVWFSAHPRCMIMLYKSLVGFALEYGSVCYSGMARTHMLRLERVQYRRIRIALGLMCSTLAKALGSSLAYHLYIVIQYVYSVWLGKQGEYVRRVKMVIEY